jgi:hypothetical protein
MTPLKTAKAAAHATAQIVRDRRASLQSSMHLDAPPVRGRLRPGFLAATMPLGAMRGWVFLCRANPTG